jgi:Arc/MetJ-type ribon-helix-helix transcriptional regulator
MNGTTYDSKINVRLPKPLVMHLRKLARLDDLKVSDLVRKALRKTYGPPKQ